MELKDIKLKKGMTKNEVNELICEWVILEDEIYLGAAHKHNWKCKCGSLTSGRKWSYIKTKNIFICSDCEHKKIEERYKYEVEKFGEYEYIRMYKQGETLPNGKVAKASSFMQIKHKFCESVYEVAPSMFTTRGVRCGKCCGSYENSFAYHIEVELNEPLDKYWDFEKNTLNPYTISRNKHDKVFIKCPDVTYHDSYEVICSDFIRGYRCSYCSNRKTHPKDSFAQYHIDNTDKDFLEKYWDYDKNIVDPFEVSPSSNKKIWIKCNNKDKPYHINYDLKCSDFTRGSRCRYCCNQDVHKLDSFGYYNLDKVQSWHLDNEISPFMVSNKSCKKYKFICETCGNVFKKDIRKITVRDQWCPECSMSTGEKEIRRILMLNNIDYEYEKEFDGLVGLGDGNLSYDFYLPDYKLLIEYQGDQHKRYIPGFHINQEKFETQLEHDRRKRQYSINNGYGQVIEIWEDDYNNIESILQKEINHSNPTKSGS